MSIAELGLLNVLAMGALYWIAVVGAWMFRVSCPEARAAARKRAFAGRSIDPATGEITMTFQGAIDVSRVLRIMLVPPAAFLILWAVLRSL